MNNVVAMQSFRDLVTKQPSARRELQQLGSFLRSFATHGLREVGEQSLMSRFDTKYLLPLHHLEEFLRRIRGDYSLLEIEGKVVHGYQTEYFDTPSFAHYFSHHNNRSPRRKVRC